MAELNIRQILEYLPHRYPFILVDKVIELDPGKRAVAIKNVTINEPFFTGHFPDVPVMPGVLILEALAQASVLVSYNSPDAPHAGSLHLFAGIDNVRFKRMVEPGDQLRLEVEVIKAKQGVWKMHGVAMVDGELVCSADLMSAMRDL